MKRYEKTINGKTVRKQLKDITIKKNGMVTYNPTEEMVLADGWVEYITPTYEPTEEELLKQAKERVVRRINDYDSSPSVNECIITYNGSSISYWADKIQRSSLKTAVENYLANGNTYYRLDIREQRVYFDIPCEALLSMLSALEVYAIQCYNKTTDHLYAVEALTTVEEIEAYDYRSGYPEKLTFDL